MRKWEYETIIFNTKGIFNSSFDADSFKRTLNEFGQEGWELIEQTTSTQLGDTRSMFCVFRREIT